MKEFIIGLLTGYILTANFDKIYAQLIVFISNL